MKPWPDVDVDEYGQMACPVLLCDATLYLTRTYCIPLFAEQSVGHEPQDAVTDRWQVECINGHVLHDGIDQIRQMNADGAEEDETGDSMPEYDHFLTHERINALGGERR